MSVVGINLRKKRINHDGKGQPTEIAVHVSNIKAGDHGEIIIEFKGDNAQEIGYSDNLTAYDRETEYTGHLTLRPETVCDIVCQLLKKEK